MAFDFYLLDYNNYYNRQLKKLDTLNEYINGGYLLNAFFDKNFDFNDGVNSSIVINYQGQVKTPNYCLIENRNTGEFTRWFVIDERKERGSQYTFTLRRDVMADFKDSVLNSTYFIERGYVGNGNPLVFNQEDFNFNKIKKSQKLLTDESACPWIVGFIPSDYPNESSETIGVHSPEVNADYTVNRLSDWEYNDYVGIGPVGRPTRYIKIDDGEFNGVHYGPSDNYTVMFNCFHYGYDPRYSDRKWYWSEQFNFDCYGNKKSVDTSTEYSTGFNRWTVTKEAYDRATDYFKIITPRNTSQSYYCLQYVNTAFYTDMTTKLGKTYEILNGLRILNGIDDITYNTLMSNYNGKTIYDRTNNKLYSISIKTNALVKNHDPIDLTGTIVEARVKASTPTPTSDLMYDNRQNGGKVSVVNQWLETYIQLLPIESGQNITLTKIRNHLIDAPYDMFCMPYSDDISISIANNDGTVTNLRSNKILNYNMATGIIAKLAGTTEIADLQLLPYCPIRDKLSGKSISSREDDISYIKAGENKLGVVFWCGSSNVDIPKLIGPENDDYNIEIINYKKSNCLEEYRLCSPSYASVFEFSPSKNYGVEGFQVSFTYKPHNSYIKIKPQFRGLYGENFKDQRGLILQGDFSMPQLTNAWSTYELQNKNYQNTFDREIKSMELQRKYGNIQNGIGAVTGALQGAAGGALVGGGVGAAVGGVASLAGGIADAAMSNTLAKDGIDKYKTLFNYSIENIQAIPSTIKNVGAYTIDNLKFPFLEVYGCTQQEEEMFDMNIKYNGMTINTVGKIKDYYNLSEETFVRGTLIRLEPGEDVIEDMDTHLARTINEEINKGIYIGG